MVWAPSARSLAVHTADGVHALERGDDGLHRRCFPGAAGVQYLLAVDRDELHPDPCSRHQPHGVRAPSEVVDTGAFEWTDGAWQGVALDVVYKHLGPGSDALCAFGPYLSSGRRTSWGRAIDYTQPGVRERALQSAELWVLDYHVDGLRLDAAGTIVDDTPRHICAELAERVHTANGRALVVSEIEDDDWRPIDEWGHDAQWADRVHHELHVLLTGERDGHYRRHGSVASLADDLRGRGHDPRRLVVCAQNHDQVGNRAMGDRLPPDALHVAAAVTLFSTCTPLLFMGEEYFERRPFQFFADHIDPEVAEGTRAGRLRELESSRALAAEEVPDPQDVETFLRSKLDRRGPDPFYRELVELHRTLPRELEVVEADGAAGRLRLRRGSVELAVDFGSRRVEVRR